MGPGGTVWALLRERSTKRVLVALLVVSAVTFPAIASSKTKKPKAHFPSCSALSHKALADIAQTGTLKLEKKIGNLCIFYGEHRGHYKPALDVQMIPYIKSIWDLAKTDAVKSAAKDGDDYGQVNSKMFFVSGKKSDAGLPPCSKDYGSPGKGQSKFGPACSPEPDLEHFTVIGNGTDKRNGLHVMVSGALSGQEGDVHLSHVITLVKEVISGKLH